MLKIIPTPAQCGMTGFESPASEYTQVGLSLDQHLVADPEATYLCFAEGDSMQGFGIFSGDMLIVCTAAQVNDGDVIVANLNGDFVCKKIDLQRQQLVSAGKGYAAYQLREGEEFQVEGVGISSIRMHRPFTMRSSEL
ncbi:MAG: SOS mutagenesis protein RulA [Osedax symbiont Rs2]|nr:MAG: SOS mutagenesis protein RulA [Osedax symbiont Rs2]